MGFTEVASDDGEVSGRGSPPTRGVVTGGMTLVGGLGHTLPYLIPDFWIATWLAIAVVFVELWAIAYVKSRFMRSSLSRSVVQIAAVTALIAHFA